MVMMNQVNNKEKLFKISKYVFLRKIKHVIVIMSHFHVTLFNLKVACYSKTFTSSTLPLPTVL